MQELSLHPRQFQVFDSPKRFRVLVAGRRFGKTELALAELTRAAETTPNQLVWYGGLVKQSELESAGRAMDSSIFRQEFEAEFTAIGSYRAYLSFDHERNIRDVRFEPSEPLIWSLDFNVDPMCMLLMQRIADDVNVLEEIAVRSNSNTTEEACRIFVQHAEPYIKIVSRIHGILDVYIYGDASGHQRRTSATATDWNLIRDLEEVCFTTDSTGAPTSELNKSDRQRTHMSDALGYYISQSFPLRGTFQLPL